MRNKRVRWIRKVVLSKHPKVTEMLQDRYGEEKANTMLNGQVIKFCKKMWTRHVEGVEEWGIYKEKLKRGEA